MAAPLLCVDERIKEWATQAQCQYIDAVNKYGSTRIAARELGINNTTISRAIKAAVDRAALGGYSPAHDLTRPVAPGQRLRGASTLYKRGEPEPVLQWVKTREDDVRREEIMRAAVAALMEDIPRATPVAGPLETIEHLCNLYTLTDSHVGMKSWPKETGEDWDLSIAERVLCGAFSASVETAPRAAVGLVAFLGDFMHFDSLVAETPTNKHPLDADSRYSKVVGVAIKIIRTIIASALARHDRVVLVVLEGNHDPVGTVWIRHLLSLLYEIEPRINVIQSELPYVVYQHGSVMIGWHHGHLQKKDNLPLLFAAQFSKTWGETTKRYIHTGHLHHTDEKEHPGVMVIQHPTLAARDSYAARYGYLAERQIITMTYHARFGNVARSMVTPEMLA